MSTISNLPPLPDSSLTATVYIPVADESTTYFTTLQKIATFIEGEYSIGSTGATGATGPLGLKGATG